MSSTEVKVFPTPDEKGGTFAVIETRTGSALPLKEPQVISLSGNIESIGAFLSARRKSIMEGSALLNQAGLQTIDSRKAVVVVDENEGTIVLFLDPENAYGAKVSGKLVESVELDIFRVNENEMYSREQLIKLLRFNRSYFPHKDKHEALVGAFMKFSVNAYVQLDKENDQRGNASAMFKQTVNSSVPLSFTLEMPIYKGQPNERFDVEICIEVHGSNVRFYFESVQLAELLQVRKTEIFAKELAHCADFPIIKK